MPCELAHRGSWLLLLLFVSTAPLAQTQQPWPQTQPRRVLFPIGGDYLTAVSGFASVLNRQAVGPAVNIVLVPAAFADDPVLPEDPVILAEDVEAVRLACDAVVNKTAFPAGCEVSSVPLYVAADASNFDIVVALSDPVIDGIFFTGGDQGYAMKVLADTPAERAMSVAAARGVAFGGTSAGAAIQSLVMNAGYTETGDSTTALQKASIDMWFGHPPEQRGLSLGSRRVVIDEHLYSRGRLGRMMNAAAQSADRLGDGGLLALGFDWDTGGAIQDDRWLASIAGYSSGAIIDFRSAGARHRWVGPQAALSARRVLAHLLPPGAGVRFDLSERVPLLNGHPLPWKAASRERGTPRADGRATLILGGDISQDIAGPVMRAFIRHAAPERQGKIVIVAGGYPSFARAEAKAALYARGIREAGWQGSTRTFVFGQSPFDADQLKGASGVVLIGGDQSRLGAVLTDLGFRAFVDSAVRQVDVVMLDHAMAAAAGEHFDAVGEGASEDDAINAFRADHAVVRPGLGLVRGATFEPRLQIDKRWGRLFGMGAKRKQAAVYGISEGSAIVLRGQRSRVIGRNPVVSLDARQARFVTGSNGTLGALNVLLNVYEPGEGLDN